MQMRKVQISSMNNSPTLTTVIYNYINKLISHEPDFRFNSNFAGVVYLLSSTCIPNKKKIHITLLPFAYVNCLSPSNILLHK